MGQKDPARESRRRASKKAGVTERQQYWLEHLRSCEASGEAIKAYAERHGLSVYALYEARRRQRRPRASRSVASAPRVSFAKVSSPVSPAREPRWRVRFLNGTVVEWDVTPEGEPLDSLLESIARLP